MPLSAFLHRLQITQRTSTYPTLQSPSFPHRKAPYLILAIRSSSTRVSIDGIERVWKVPPRPLGVGQKVRAMTVARSGSDVIDVGRMGGSRNLTMGLRRR